MQLIIESSDEKVIQMILEMIRPLNVNFQEVKADSTALGLPQQSTDVEPAAKRVRKLGIMPGLVAYMAPDFNAPLDDFAEYMH